jgi:hypothetical protein
MDRKREERIENKVDQIANDIADMKVVQARHEESLNYHIKRTDILEGQIAPIIEFKARFVGASKLVGLLALGAGIAEGIVALLEYLK